MNRLQLVFAWNPDAADRPHLLTELERQIDDVIIEHGGISAVTFPDKIAARVEWQFKHQPNNAFPNLGFGKDGIYVFNERGRNLEE